jgi:hypothetical protein
MVHRDIKPENILLARDGSGWQPKIADFGIVATKESSSVFTRTGGTLLTVAYAAPEQWRGTPAAELDGRTDLYALGGLLYEMLTGQTPFHAESYEGWARQHQTTPPPPPSALRPELANWHGLDALVLRLLAKDREDRPKDVAVLLGLLDAVRFVPPTIVRPVTELANPGIGSYKGGEGTARHIPVWIWIATAALLIVAAFAVGKFFGTQPPNPPQHLIAQTTPAIQPQPVEPIPAQVVNPKASNPNPGSNQEPEAVQTKNTESLVLKPRILEIMEQGEDLFNRKQYGEAAPLLEKACTSGEQFACSCLGNMYDQGLGVTVDYHRAATLYSKTCTAGTVSDCYNLGLLYEDGHGVVQDYARAAVLYSKVCDRGSGEGCTGLGDLYSNGHGVFQDEPKARRLYNKGCTLGDQLGCRRLNGAQ